MKITELKEGTELVLEIVWGDSSYEIPSKIVLSMAGRVFIQSFTYKGATLDLNHPSFRGMVFNIYAHPDSSGARLVWRSVSLEMRVVRAKVFYEVKASGFCADGQECERRDAQRIRIGIPGVLRIPTENREINVEIYDFSRDGVAFLSKENMKLIGALVEVFFEETVRNHPFEVHVTARCVRKKEDERILYGCHIRAMDHDALAYLTQKSMDVQMEAIERKRREQENQDVEIGNGESIINLQRS